MEQVILVQIAMLDEHALCCAHYLCDRRRLSARPRPKALRFIGRNWRRHPVPSHHAHGGIEFRFAQRQRAVLGVQREAGDFDFCPTLAETVQVGKRCFDWVWSTVHDMYSAMTVSLPTSGVV